MAIWLHYLGDERYDFPKPGPIPGFPPHLPGDKVAVDDALLTEFNRPLGDESAKQYALFIAGVYNAGDGMPQRYEVLQGNDADSATVLTDDAEPEPAPTPALSPAVVPATSARTRRQNAPPTDSTTDAAPQAPQGE